MRIEAELHAGFELQQAFKLIPADKVPLRRIIGKGLHDPIEYSLPLEHFNECTVGTAAVWPACA